MDVFAGLALLAEGLAVGTAAWGLLDFALTPSGVAAPANSFEQARRQKLSTANILWRWFPAGLDKLARHHAGMSPARRDELRRTLQSGGSDLAIAPEEFLALKQFESGLLALGLFLLGYVAIGVLAGLLFGAAGGLLYYWLAVQAVVGKSRARLARIKKRLPFTIDLMALMMEAGADFHESLATAVREAQGHPLGEELGQVLRDVGLGRTRHEALVTLRDRLADDDVAEIVFAVNQGEELGTPLAQILRTQADQMRLKRSQWAEKAAGEAQVNIVFPGMVIMIACLLIVIAPFILSALFASS